MKKKRTRISINQKTWAGTRFFNLANARKKSAGFTLLELLMTIAILTTVAIFGSINLFNYYSRQNLSLTVDEIIAFLRDAQNRSLTQESGDQWGVHFSNATTTNFQLFRGLSFASSTLVMNRDLRPGVQFVDPAVGSSTDVIFSKITGYPNASTSIILVLNNNPTQAYTITISAVGVAAKTFGTITTISGVPSGLVASPGYQKITLNWNAPASDGGSPITNYKIYRGNSPGGESYLTTLGNVLTYIDTGLTDGLTYYYQVSAVNAKGEGLKSNEANAVSGDATPPIAGSVTPANTSYGSYVDTPFDLSTVFTDNESAVTSCEYTINGTTWNAAIVSGTSLIYTCSQSGISSSNGTVLSLNMRATSSGGTTTATPVSRTVDGLAPSDGVLTASSSSGQVYLSWTAATDSGSGLAPSNTYKLVFSAVSSPAANCANGTQIYLGTGISYNHTGLTNGVTYYYRVCASDAVNNISIGATANAMPSAPGDATPPSAGLVTPANTSYGFYVDTPFDLSTVFTDNESAVTSCQYTINGGTNWYAATVSGTSLIYTCSKSGITSSNGTVLSLNMRATSSGGTTTATPVSRTVDGLAPSLGNIDFSDGFEDGILGPFTTDGSANWVITNSTANTGIYSAQAGHILDNQSTNMYLAQTIGIGGRVISFARSVSSEAGWDYLKFYIDGVQVSPTSGSQWAGTVAWGNVNFSVPAGSHTFKWHYMKDGSVSTASDTAWVDDVLIKDNGVLIPTPSSSAISLSWTAATDSGSGLATSNTYKLVFSTVSLPAANCTDGTQIYLGTDTSYPHTGLTNGTTYYYRVCASDAVNNISTGATAQAAPSAFGPGRYWVGGTGNWSDTAHWSVSPGGAGGASVPTVNDDVYFNANSFTATGQIVTINATANTKSINWTGVNYTPTLAGFSTLNIKGSLTLVSGMNRTFTGSINFTATSTGQTIALAGKILGSNTTFNGTGGGWTLLDDFNDGTSYSITLTMGSLNTNGKTVTAYSFSSSNSNVRTLTLGGSAINLSGAGTAWNFSIVTNLTFNVGTSTIILNGSSPTFAGGGLTYNNVIFSGIGMPTISGTNTFANLTRTGTAVSTNGLYFAANQTITGVLTLTGNSSTNRLLVQSNTLGTSRTLTAAAVSFTNVDFQDISGAGTAAPFSGTSLGDALGNSNINFTTAVTRYWVGGTGNWSDTAHWSASSGGAGSATVPLPQDTVIFDASSITLASQTVTANMPRLGKDINFSAVANNPTLSFGSTVNTIYGSLTLGSNMTISGTQDLTFSPRSAVNLTNNGRTFTNAIAIDALGGTITMQDGFNSNSSLTLTRGTLTANNQNITAASFSSFNSNVRTINMGSGIWTLTGTGTVWNTSAVSNLTLNANTSSVVINNNSATAKTFAGGSRTFYGLRFTNTGTGALTISGSNIFNNLTVDTPPKYVNFTAASTQTVNGAFTANGSAGNLITLRSTTSGSKWTISAATANTSYVDVQDSTASGAGSPFSCPSLVLSTDFSDGFEDGTLGTFTTNGAANWGVTTSTVNTGIYSAQAGHILDNGTTSMYLAQTIGTGGRYLSFARRVSSEAGWDYLKFYIDGVQVSPTSGSQWAGTVAWGNVNFSVPAGSHTFKWHYMKDGSLSTASDTAWVDDVLIRNLDNCINSGNNIGWSF